MRYIPHTKRDVERMLEAVGADSVDKLFDSIPERFQLQRDLALPSPLDEEALIRHFNQLADGNCSSAKCGASFLGAGAYWHHIPAAVGQMLLRGEFFTAYTPYQPEASQGTLQAIFEYQSMIAALIGCEVVNASMYDGATAAAEALLMALRAQRKRKRILLGRAVHPEHRAVCQTYLSETPAALESIPFTTAGLTDLDALAQALDETVAAVLIQQPNALGNIEDLETIGRLVHEAGALLVVSVLEPVSLGLLEAPGKLGADVVTGEGMGLGSGLNFGGPGLGLFGTQQKFAWQMPGRLVGQTTDEQERTGYVLTMATREQHIRRARATSNICTNEGLCALAAAIHLSLLGKTGFAELARTNAANARELCRRLDELPGVQRKFSAPFFNEFVVQIEGDVPQKLHQMAQSGIIGGLALEKFYPELSNCLLLCATEMNTLDQVERLVAALES